MRDISHTRSLSKEKKLNHSELINQKSPKKKYIVEKAR
jgi:hypothetical protein